jgi:hypothetical protein
MIVEKLKDECWVIYNITLKGGGHIKYNNRMKNIKILKGGIL